MGAVAEIGAMPANQDASRPCFSPCTHHGSAALTVNGAEPPAVTL